MSKSVFMETIRKMFGENMFSVDQAAAFFKIQRTKEMLGYFERTMPKESELMAHSKTHLLVADFGISLNGLQNGIGQGMFDADRVNDGYKYARIEEIPQWRLIKKEIVLHSFGKDWKAQRKLLSDNEEVPKIRQMAYAVLMDHSVNHRWLFEEIRYVRCSDIDSRTGARIAFHVHGGYFFIYHLNQFFCGEAAIASAIHHGIWKPKTSWVFERR